MKKLSMILAATLLAGALAACTPAPETKPVTPLPSPEEMPVGTATPEDLEIPPAVIEDGVGEEQPPVEVEPLTFEGTYGEALTALKLTEYPAMTDATPELIEEFYGIKPEKYTQQRVVMSLMNVRTHEIALFMAKDEKAVADIKKGMEKRIAAQSEIFKTYLADQYELLQNAVIKSEGTKVVMVVGENAEAIATQLLAEMK